MRRLVSAIVAAGLAAGPCLADPPEQPFLDNCSACHQPTGLGVKGAFPALAGDPFVQHDASPVVTVVLDGRGGMPRFADQLSDAEIAAILTYVRSAWGNRAGPVTAAQVAADRAKPAAPAAMPGVQAH